MLAGTTAPALALSTSRAVTTAAAIHQGAVTLSMDNVTRMYQAIVNLAIASKGHPEFEDVLSVDGDASEAQATAKIATVAVAVDALKKAGLTPAQYAADIEAVQKRLAAQMAAAGVGQ